jgi:hypothetical protein
MSLKDSKHLSFSSIAWCNSIEDFQSEQYQLLKEFYDAHSEWQDWCFSVAHSMMDIQDNYEVKLAIFFGSLCFDRSYHSDAKAAHSIADSFNDFLFGQEDYDSQKVHDFLTKAFTRAKKSKAKPDELIAVLTECLEVWEHYNEEDEKEDHK